MEDLVCTTFQATKESCVLTSLGYAFNYIANVQRLKAPNVEEVFLSYIEYYRKTHKDNGLSGKKLIDWARDKAFSKKNFPKDSKKIENMYNPAYNFEHIGNSSIELLSTIMLHWVCQFENKEINNGTGKRGYDEIIDFWNFCKTDVKFKDLLANVEIGGHKTSLNENYTSEVAQHLSSGDALGIALYPLDGAGHSILVYRAGDEYIARNPTKKSVEVIDIESLEIREYIIFHISKSHN